MQKQGRKTLIFDFDGTIADTFGYFAHFLNQKAKASHLDSTRLELLKGLSLWPAARKLGHKWWRMPGLYYAGRLWLSTVIDDVPAFDGIINTLDTLHAEGYQMYIISSNSPENIRAFLERQKAQTDFKRIDGNIFWSGKRRAIQRIVHQNKLSGSQVYYIGDEVRDIRAARRAGIKSIAVTWGYNTKEDLKSQKPDLLCTSPKELESYFNK